MAGNFSDGTSKMTQEKFDITEKIWRLQYTLKHLHDGTVHWEIVDELAKLRKELKRR